MKTKLGVLLGVGVIALGGCSTIEDRQRASGNFNYVDASVQTPVSVPEGLDSPTYSDEYNIPEIGSSAPSNLYGKKLIIASPALVLPLVTGSHIEEGNKSATVNFDQIDDSTPLDKTVWNTLISFLEQNSIGVESFEPEEGTLITDWMLIKQEEDSSWYSWSTTKSETGRRFEFKLDVAPHGRTASLNVALKDYIKKVDDSVVASIEDVQKRAEEVDILNQVIGHYDYQIGLENSKRRQQIRQGLTVEMGFNADGDPAFIIDGKYDIAWPRLQLVLRKLGFNVKDLDKSNGLLFVTYGGEEGSWWTTLFSSDDELLDEGDYRLKVSSVGAKTSLTFMDDESSPFAANQVADLYAVFSDAMSQDDLDI
ncbi:outer membrane protein assembly factor BamC [Alteromonas sediminis]|uniref:Outer membrane protein assembly factor BamC n=1 Tax=Alteromonas sediminis TaxID=2259342 RepID=A0A3N5Y8M1_9ALTE|nr:outer membrane protein assembly factor BamC [Alteromonas sediminis]RPJ67459.1 outer membrane protein assembly factor BamC [Alteromonas sediminis]